MGSAVVIVDHFPVLASPDSPETQNSITRETASVTRVCLELELECPKSLESFGTPEVSEVSKVSKFP